MSTPRRHGDPCPLAVFLGDNSAGKFVRARVYDDTDTEQTAAPISSPVSLPLVATGVHKAEINMPNKAYIYARYEIADDAGFSEESETHENGGETFTLEPNVVDPSAFIRADLELQTEPESNIETKIDPDENHEVEIRIEDAIDVRVEDGDDLEAAIDPDEDVEAVVKCGY